jgi:hypothetical protein
MSNTTRADTLKSHLPGLVAATMFAMATAIASAQALSRTQQPLSPIAAATAIGDIPQLNGALNHGFDAGPLFRVEK